MPKKVMIIGGAGTIGTLYGDMFLDYGHNVGIIDPALKSEEIAKAHGYNYIDCKKSGYENSLADANYVIFSVPIEDTAATIAKYAEYISSGTTVMDVTSVKEFAVEAMLDSIANPDINIIGTHPMFRPGKDNSFEGQNVVLTKERIVDDGIYEEIKSMFENKGAKTIETTAEEHDRTMAVIQCLMHTSGYTIMKSIEDSGYTLEQLELMSSPLYRTALAFTGRLLEGNASLSASILKYNRYAPEVAEHLKDNAAGFSELVTKGDNDAIETYIIGRKKYAQKFIDKTKDMVNQMLQTKKRGIEIYYFERHNEMIKRILGDGITVEQYKGKNHIWKKVRKEKEESAEKKNEPLKDNVDEDKIGKLMKGLVVNEGLLNKLKKYGCVFADEIFWNSEEYEGDGRYVFTINSGRYIKNVLSNVDFVRHVLKDEELADSLTMDESISYGRLKFDTQERKSEVHKDWYSVVMKNMYDTDPILKFFKTIRMGKWEETFGQPIIVFRTPKRRMQEEKKKKSA